jgi:uncharacterized protein YfaS (alpha-2-macroglobulin family)
MSRFFPAISARRVLGGSAHRWSEKLPAVVEAGLQRLYHFQHADGGWGWWECDKTNEGMTAYVLYGLSLCKKAGVEVDAAVAKRAATLLGDRLRKAVEAGEVPGWARMPLPVKVEPRVFALLALAEHETAFGGPSDPTMRLAQDLPAELGRLQELDADLAEALWVLDQPRERFDLSALVSDTLASLSRLAPAREALLRTFDDARRAQVEDRASATRTVLSPADAYLDIPGRDPSAG